MAVFSVLLFATLCLLDLHEDMGSAHHDDGLHFPQVLRLPRQGRHHAHWRQILQTP